MRIQGKLNWTEFKNICENKGITNMIDISKRWEFYKMIRNGLNDGRSDTEVGLGIKVDNN